MVGPLSIAAMFITMLVPIGLFIVLLILFLRHFHTGMRPVLIGAAVFFVFALVLEQLVHLAVLRGIPATAALFKNPLAYAVYGGLAAGLFEETGRLCGFSLFFKKSHRWEHGVAYGLGHGGLELLYIGGVLALTQVNNLVLSFAINSGRWKQIADAVTAFSDKAAALETARNQLVSLPAWAFLLGGWERLSALGIQIALSLLVLYAVARRRYVFYLLAVLLHALVDFGAVYLKQLGVNMAVLEGVLTLFAVVLLVPALRSRRFFPEEAPAATPQDAS